MKTSKCYSHIAVRAQFQWKWKHPASRHILFYLREWSFSREETKEKSNNIVIVLELSFGTWRFRWSVGPLFNSPSAYHLEKKTTSCFLSSFLCPNSKSKRLRKPLRSESTTADKPNPTAELKANARTASPSLLVIRGTASSWVRMSTEKEGDLQPRTEVHKHTSSTRAYTL